MQRRLTIKMFGISSVDAFLKAVDQCREPVFLDFDGTYYNLKEDEKLRKILSSMASDDRLDAILPVSAAQKDLDLIIGVMNKRAA